MVSPKARPRAVVFDVGGVILETTISGQIVRDILSTPIWHSYERGEVARDACYELSAQRFSLPVSEVCRAFAQFYKTPQINQAIASFIRDLREDSSIAVHVMSNMGREDFEDVAAYLDLRLFDRVFISAETGMRKPDSGFYYHVLDHIGLVGSQVVFIDDKEENVHAAQSLGIHSLVYGSSTLVTLRQIFKSPIARGWGYLYRNVPRCETATSAGFTVSENFANLLIADSLQDNTLTNLTWGSKKTWNFFSTEEVPLPEGCYSDDTETTSLALKVLGPSPNEAVSRTLDRIMTYLKDDGNFKLLYDHNRERFDPICTSTILACFYAYGRGHELEKTLQLMLSILLDRSYLQGTRYYPSPDLCLGYFGRLLRASDDTHLHTTLGPLLKLRVCERVGLRGSALDLAMRVITCTQMGVACEGDRHDLLDLQCEDGRWEGGWLYQFGKSKIKMTNVCVTTALAIEALSS
ncbi:HAD-like protein [Xylaria sp. FL0933]|nr:HAD-like protein [Xylaria sp. FL0933]